MRFASAIGQAVSEHLNPQLSRITETLERIDATLGEHGTKLDRIDATLEAHGGKLDQLISGAVGIGRITKLEDRVTALEQRLPPPGE